MGSCYAADAPTIVRILLDCAVLKIQEAAAVREALDAYTCGGLDLHDCLIVALNNARGAQTATFDRKAAKKLAMQLLQESWEHMP